MSALKRIRTGAPRSPRSAAECRARGRPAHEDGAAPPCAMSMPPPMFTWTGFYVGLNAGAAIGDSRYQYAPYFNNYAQSGVGFTGGGQVGYNWQTGAAGARHRDRHQLSQRVVEFRRSPASAARTTPPAISVRSAVGVGYAVDRLLLYGTGGLAYGNTNFPTSVVGLDAFGTPRAFYGQQQQRHERRLDRRRRRTNTR